MDLEWQMNNKIDMLESKINRINMSNSNNSSIGMLNSNIPMMMPGNLLLENNECFFLRQQQEETQQELDKLKNQHAKLKNLFIKQCKITKELFSKYCHITEEESRMLGENITIEEDDAC